MLTGKLKFPVSITQAIYHNGQRLDSFLSQISSGEGVSHWNGKTINFLGDSITAYTKFVESYKGLTGAVCNNYGVGGTHIAKTNASNGTAFEARYSSMPIADMVIVFGGTNDFGHTDTALFGEFSDGTTADKYTFYAGLHRLFKGLQEKYVGKPVVIITPLHHGVKVDVSEYRINGSMEQSQATGSKTVNYFDYIEVPNPTSGKTFREYVEAIKEVAAFYSLIVLDAYSFSGINPALSTPYSGDGLHPSEAGAMKLAQWMYPLLENVYRQFYND